MVWKNFVFLW